MFKQIAQTRVLSLCTWIPLHHLQKIQVSLIVHNTELPLLLSYSPNSSSESLQDAKVLAMFLFAGMSICIGGTSYPTRCGIPRKKKHTWGTMTTPEALCSWLGVSAGKGQPAVDCPLPQSHLASYAVPLKLARHPLPPIAPSRPHNGFDTGALDVCGVWIMVEFV